MFIIALPANKVEEPACNESPAAAIAAVSDPGFN